MYWRPQDDIVNLTDHRAAGSRNAQLDLLKALGPGGIVRAFEELQGDADLTQPELPHLVMPAHHEVRSPDVFVRRASRCRNSSRP